jgi:O-antigen ligase
MIRKGGLPTGTGTGKALLPLPRRSKHDRFMTPGADRETETITMRSRKRLKDRLATRYNIGLRGLLIFCLPLCFLASVENVYASSAGAAITYLLVVLVLFKSAFDLFHGQGASLQSLKANSWLICLLLYSCASIFWTEDKARGLPIIVQLMTIASIAIMSGGVPLHAASLPLATLPLKLNLLLNAAVFLIEVPGGFAGQGFAGIYANPNFCATALFLISFFVLLEYKASGNRMMLFMIVCGIVMIIFTGSRAVLLALAIALAANLLPQAGKKRLFWPTVGLIAMFIYAYLYQAAQITRIEDSGMVQTGKDIFSGRQIIWDHVLQRIQHAPWLGYGLGSVPATYGGVHEYDGKSIHNLYLQTWYQTGLIGLMLLILTLRQKYRDLTNQNGSAADGPAQLAGAYLIGILVIQTFEVDLTQNNFAAALGMWLIITSGAAATGPARALPVSRSSRPQAKAATQTRTQRAYRRVGGL